MCVCNLLYIQEWGHSRCAYYCYLFACCAWFILWGDRGEGWGALSNEAPPPHPRKRTHFVCSWVPEWAALHFHFHLISFCAIPSVWLSGAGPIPQRIHLILFCRYAIPSVWRTFGIKIFIHFSCVFEPVLSRVHSISTCLVRVCVCVTCCTYRNGITPDM